MYGKFQTTYHDIILGHGHPVLRGRNAHKNFWGEQSRWSGRPRIRFDRTVIEPQDSERFENKRWYLGKGDGAHHCRLCIAVHHVFHRRREQWARDRRVS